MKRNILYFVLIAVALFALTGCKKNGEYPGATLSPYIAVMDLRNLYKNQDIKINNALTGGADSIAVTVSSDHTSSNLPDSLLIVQDSRRLSSLRGIAINIGKQASNYTTGDSLIIKINGGTIGRRNGILEILDLTTNQIRKVSSGNILPINRVKISDIQAHPGNYECTQVAIVKGSFNPHLTPGETLAGTKYINDGFGNIPLQTLKNASFADSLAPSLANYYGIILDSAYGIDVHQPSIRLRKYTDLVALSSSSSSQPIIISGFMSDAKGTDANYEYIQLLATQDIDFSQTHYALVTCNNAGASTPSGYPVNGWATGGMRTYKFNLLTGKVTKGTYFYVGGTAQAIDGLGSTSMSSSIWIRSLNYSISPGDGFGIATANLLANSGNAFGMAVFNDTLVNANSVPVDVIFIGSSGSLYTAGPPVKGYRITSTDWYDMIDPITLIAQPYFKMSTSINASCLSYNTADQGIFNMLGGVYNTSMGRWTTARKQTNVLLSSNSTISAIENSNATQIQ